LTTEADHNRGYSGGRRDPVSQGPSTFVACPTRLIVDTVPSHTKKDNPRVALSLILTVGDADRRLRLHFK